EGWAEYWAHTLGTCTSNTQDFNYEGNVATALDGLEKCSSRPTMVRVLRENPAGVTGVIHSYSEFKSKWDAIVGPRGCLIRPPITGVEGVEPTLSSSQVIAGAQQQISAVNRLIARLSSRMTSANRIARRVGPCR